MYYVSIRDAVNMGSLRWLGKRVTSVLDGGTLPRSVVDIKRRSSCLRGSCIGHRKTLGR